MIVLTGADIRGFYTALGIELPGWAQREAPAHCFAAPDVHNREDRTPSTSVNLETGAWYCHGCGASGGAYHAARAVGCSHESAIELMADHGLVERSGRFLAQEPALSSTTRPSRASEPRDAALNVSESDLKRWQESLLRRPALVASLQRERAWALPVMRELGLGLDCSGRVTIPIRDADEALRGVLRYQPWPAGEPKMLAAPGTRLGLMPHPARERSPWVILVEGPPDMLAARTYGLPAIAVPGARAWRREWAQPLTGRRVTVVMDCDLPGRAAARRIAADLRGRCEIEVIDLDQRRGDGYDLTDALLSHPQYTVVGIRHSASWPPPATRSREELER
ncbi:MAG: toprim domain-containing protein [Solirubrobacteraceae bacterium]